MKGPCTSCAKPVDQPYSKLCKICFTKRAKRVEFERDRVRSKLGAEARKQEQPS